MSSKPAALAAGSLAGMAGLLVFLVLHQVSQKGENMSPSLKTVLTVTVFVDAFGWFLGVVPTLYYALTRGTLPTVAGLRLLSGPFEKLGLNGLIVAGLIFAVVSGIKVLAGYWLWNSRLDGAVLELILLGLSAIFWYGFALPFGPPVGIIQVVLLALVWPALR